MKKLVSVVILLVIVMLTVSPSLTASVHVDPKEEKFDYYVSELVKKQPGITTEEMEEALTLASEETRKPEMVIAKQALRELNQAIKQEHSENGTTISIMGGSSGAYKLEPARNKGDIFYTPSSTLGIQHGHNGIYHTTTNIVESIPDTGVRKIKYNARNVEAKAVMQYVQSSQSNRDKAADWANARAGIDAYSYNFATNRYTDKYGDKNCSKLVWSAYILEANVDLDKNQGFGVYPADIRDSSYTVTYNTIQ
ncbi:hypothetical protein GI584_08540 [Gracilibacillus salitolerans]|uniref:Permuted papain-like amidase enzyme, YaeF/YiiX, C92 family n=1 Tax=Gracilibacillus salitolerans TaxID=2663022 RepID=A0A5Q2TJ90_9BACI|nr:hypothetical protein [Gracilibacillus salitolerans]QGH34063.1 hypothetical protein GI584_08540 [Gracilibacillus salitolerans]